MRYMLPREDNIDKLINSLREFNLNQLWVKRFIDDSIQALERKKVHISNFIAN